MSLNPKNKKAPIPPKPRFNDVTFINWSLTDEQKAYVKSWKPTLEEFDDYVLGVLQSDHKVTVSYDEKRDNYTASIVPTSSNKTNQGFILTGKGSTPHKAIKQALYIHVEIFSGDWSSYSKVRTDEILDD